MPELVDVEGFKRYVARYAEGQRVRGVRVRDASVLRNISPARLRRALEGRRLGHPIRHGKWLVIPAGRGDLIMHFGMTGKLEWTGGARRPDRFDHVILELDGGELRYHAQRKLGGVFWIRGDLSDVTGSLGPDAAVIAPQELFDRLAHRRGSVKSALMDQSLVAGMGNELSDEVLWQARILPMARARDLTARQLGELHRAMSDVLRCSMRHGRIPTEGQWLKSARRADRATCPRCGGSLSTTRLVGRRAYFCPRCQT